MENIAAIIEKLGEYIARGVAEGRFASGHAEESYSTISLEDGRLSVSVNIRFDRGDYSAFPVRDENDSSVVILSPVMTINWSSYGGVSAHAALDHIELTQKAVAVIDELETFIPSRVTRVVETREEREERQAKDVAEEVKRVVTAYVQENLVKGLRAGGQRSGTLAVKDTEFEYTLSSGKRYSVTVKDQIVTVTRLEY